MLQSHSRIDRQQVAPDSLLHHHVTGYLVFVSLELGTALCRVLLVGIPVVASPVNEVHAQRQVGITPRIHCLIKCKTHIIVGRVKEVIAGSLTGRISVIDLVTPPVDVSLHSSREMVVNIFCIYGCGTTLQARPHA